MSELNDVQTTIGVIDGLRSRIAALEAALDATNAKYDYVEHWFANLLPVDWDKCMERWAEKVATP